MSTQEAVMGVMKIPQVTADINLDPYLYAQGDITNMVAPHSLINTDPLPTDGSMLNPINPAFDYVTYVAFSVGGTTTSTNPVYITYDLGKNINVRALSIYFEMTTASSQRIVIQVSSDGVNWIDKKTYDDVTAPETALITDSQVRYFRIKYTRSAGARSDTYIHSISVKINPLQRFY